MQYWGKPSITGGGLLQVEWEGLIQSEGLAGSPSDWDWDIVSGYLQSSWLGDLLVMAKKEEIDISLVNLSNQ